MTLQNAKDVIAKRAGFEDWSRIRPEYQERYFNDVAELYAQSNALRIAQEIEYRDLVENEPDDDDCDDDEPEPCDDCGKMHCICEYANNCTCGAWGWGKNGAYHMADCICGGGI